MPPITFDILAGSLPWDEAGGKRQKDPQQMIPQQLICKKMICSKTLGMLALLIRLIAAVAMFSVIVSAQDSLSVPLPFEVSNPKHLEWSTDEAGRIYMSACELVARSVRPEKPPRLTPKFRLVLGTKEDATLHDGAGSEVHLKTWNPARFAEAMVLMASREILKTEDIVHLTHDTLRAAEATVSVNELKAKK